ncbi:MAG: preprotein translocase subunit SecA [Candidatus Sumerlaeia bacterium]
MRPIVEKINAIYATLSSLSDEQLRARTDEFRRRLAAGETLDDLLPEAFAVVKEACRRNVGRKWEAGGNEITWDMVPFDVQLMGGIVLHEGKIAEMATGEGKTLVAVLPLYLNALEGKGAHLVTVNDYLAKRDSEWMGPIFEFLGMKVGVILTDMPPEVRRQMYACDVTYGTNNEFGFDYLRDNMTYQPEHLVQRPHHYAIIDEVDSVLIDEARTPLIISGAVERSSHQFDRVKPLVERLFKSQTLLVNRLLKEAEDLLERGDPDSVYQAGIKLVQVQKGSPKNKRLFKIFQDASNKRLAERVEADFMRDKKIRELEAELFYVIDEKSHIVDLTDNGRDVIAPGNQDAFILPDLVEGMALIEGDEKLTAEEKERAKAALRQEFDQKQELLHNMSQLLRAYALFEKDVDYVVQDNKVIIVDEFTGRLMPGRRFSDGLHQALEAKENVKIEKETRTLATITLQNYFRLYKKLAGMTGTAETEAQEFYHTYGMDVVVIPTNRPTGRVDMSDKIYLTIREKYNAVIDEVERLHALGLPVLVGTVSVEVSETLSRMLRRKGIRHNVLNAKNHSLEAQIVREAGQKGAVTIATNMAGRGTDIKLGPGVIQCERDPDSPRTRCLHCPWNPNGAPTNDAIIACGLQILGTERHEARRIDRQLRGRAGRQGDPGRSQFFISLEDNLMRLFGSDRIAAVMQRLKMEEGESIEHPFITRQIEKAQKRIEDINFERRKRTLEYDDVMNKQRETIYGLRRDILLAADLADIFLEIAANAVEREFLKHNDPKAPSEEWDLGPLTAWLQSTIPIMSFAPLRERRFADFEEFMAALGPMMREAYQKKIEIVEEGARLGLTRFVMLHTLDEEWQEHLIGIDQLQEGIHLVSHAQKDPLVEYKIRATEMFEDMIGNVYRQIFERFFRVVVVAPPGERGPRRVSFVKEEIEQMQARAAAQERAARAASKGDRAPEPEKQRPYVRQAPKVGRNEPCPCGSGKKYKHCCGNPKNQPQRTGGYLSGGPGPAAEADEPAPEDFKDES